MKHVYLPLFLLLTLQLFAQQQPSLLEKEIPITMRVNGALATQGEPIKSVLARLAQEPAIRDYHQELRDLNNALKGSDRTKIRTALGSVRTRLEAEGRERRVQLNSFVRGLDSLLNVPATTSTTEPVPADKPIPEADEEAETNTTQVEGEPAAENSYFSAGVKQNWPLLTGLASLLALVLGVMYGLARRQITRLRHREKLGSNEQLMSALRKQIQNQYEEVQQLKSENEELRRRAASVAQAVPLEIVPPVVEPEPEPEDKPDVPLAESFPAATTTPAELPVAPAPPLAPAPGPAYEDEEDDPNEVTFFLSTPNPDGSFSDLRQPDFLPSESLYQFRLSNATGTEAEFVFADDPASVNQAMSSPDRYLQPVCEYTDLRLDARNIRTLRLGRVRQSEPGDHWELVEKARVSFL